MKALVIFRKWQNDDLIALFPAIPSDIHGYFCEAYEHLGQHGGADYHGVIKATRPATVEQTVSLVKELMRIGYNLKVIKRTSQKVHQQRRAMAKWFNNTPIPTHNKRIFQENDK